MGTFRGEGEPSSESAMIERLPVIESICRAVCRRRGLADDKAEDFDAWVKLRLVETGYRAIRRYREGSSFPAYMRRVIENLFCDYHRQVAGRWRASAAARRAGLVAIRLERLVIRDAIALDQALEILRRNYGHELGERQLAALLESLPVQPSRKPSFERCLEGLTDDRRSDRQAEDRERRRLIAALLRVLTARMAALAVEDQRIVRAHCLDGVRISALARQLGLSQRSLYSRRDKTLLALRRGLEESGFRWSEVRQAMPLEAA